MSTDQPHPFVADEPTSNMCAVCGMNSRYRKHRPERKIFRYEVPVDDEWHDIPLSGAIYHVASRRDDVVEFWALSGGPEVRRTFRVVGTGQPLPEQFEHRGSCFAGGGHLVWHLIERREPSDG